MPREPQFDDNNSALLKESFRASLPLPSVLDPGFEECPAPCAFQSGQHGPTTMVLRVGAAYDLDRESAHNLAIALEYFHTASLIFDDLPCMDNAIERRGAPCVHVEFGECHRYPHRTRSHQPRLCSYLARRRCLSPETEGIHAMAYVEKRLGVEGLLNGQSLDLHYSTLPHTRETTERIARGKTVSLIRLTLVVPAMLGGAPAREIQLLERIAVCWGLGYQTIDDLKDVLQSANETGKTAARDELLDRPNIASAIGICGSRRAPRTPHARRRPHASPAAHPPPGSVVSVETPQRSRRRTAPSDR